MELKTQTRTVSGTKLVIATALLFAAGAAAFAAGAGRAQPQQSSIVKVKSCIQLPDGIQVVRTTDKLSWMSQMNYDSSWDPTYGYGYGYSYGYKYSKLPNGCRDAGHGYRNYTLTCTSATTYKVSYVPCAPTRPAPPVVVDCKNLGPGNLLSFQNDPQMVYILDQDKKRMYFPTNEVRSTWYFSPPTVAVLPNECADTYEARSSLPLGVNYRPGSFLVKTSYNTDIYAILPGNVRSKVANADIASALYGADWASKVRDVADEWWSNLQNSGITIATKVPHNGMIVRTANSTQSYLVKDGTLHPISGDVLEWAQVVSTQVITSLPRVKETVSKESIISDPTQLITLP